MLHFKETISPIILSAVNALSENCVLTATEIFDMLEYPPDEKMGDLALPCFKLSKVLRMAPVKIAASIAESFSCEAVDKAEALNGYFNIYLSGEYLAKKSKYSFSQDIFPWTRLINRKLLPFSTV